MVMKFRNYYHTFNRKQIPDKPEVRINRLNHGCKNLIFYDFPVHYHDNQSYNYPKSRSRLVRESFIFLSHCEGYFMWNFIRCVNNPSSLLKNKLLTPRQSLPYFNIVKSHTGGQWDSGSAPLICMIQHEL